MQEVMMALLVGVAVVFVVMGAPALFEVSFVEAHVERYRELIVANYLEVRAELMVASELGAAGTGLVLGLVVAGNVVVAFVLGGVGLILPSVLIRWLVSSRRERLELQVPQLLRGLASAVKAGLALPEAFRMVAKRAPEPIVQEVERIVRDYDGGLALTEAISRGRQRVGLAPFDLAMSAILVNQERGGNITETLDALAVTLTELRSVEEKIQVTTAQGRKSARVMMTVPFAALAMLYMSSPDVISLLFNDFAGQIILLVASIIISISFFWIRRIIAIDV